MNKTKNTSPNFDFNFNPNFNFNFDVGLKSTEDEDDLPPPTPKELTDEIKGFRQKNREFAATNDHETYLTVVFSCKQDKKEFLKNVGILDCHTLVDGYELARNLKISPTAPSVKLAIPLSK